MTAEDAEKALRLLIEFDISFKALAPERDEELMLNVLRYSMKNHITAYDSYYIILAHNLGTVFYTADEKLLSKLSSVGEERAKHVCTYGTT